MFLLYIVHGTVHAVVNKALYKKRKKNYPALSRSYGINCICAGLKRAIKSLQILCKQCNKMPSLIFVYLIDVLTPI